MRVSIVAGRPGSPLPLKPSLTAGLLGTGVKRLRAGFAFATGWGVDHLLEGATATPGWVNLPKRFIVGVSRGISEPAAFDKLVSLPKSEVRMFVPTKSLTKVALADPRIFHAKVVCLDVGRMGSPGYVFGASANATRSALGPQPRNFELGLAATELDVDERQRLEGEFNPWWSAAWQSSLPATNTLVSRYAKLRAGLIAERPALLDLSDPPMAIAQAEHLWIEVGQASGIQRHQVEFNQALAAFFGPPRKYRVNLRLQRGTGDWQGRPLSYKVTTYGVPIWRLGMPTKATGGFDYQQRIVWFRRTTQGRVFGFDVADKGSQKSKQWLQETSARGSFGNTRGPTPRLYGIY